MELQVLDRSSDFSANSKEVTFRGKLDIAIHNWFRMTASFSPILVEKILREWGVDEKNKEELRLLEPFAGVGTSPVVSMLNRISGSAIELNPTLFFVTKNKLHWLANNHRIAELNEAYNWISKVSGKVQKRRYSSLEDFTSKTGIKVPELANIDRWFDLQAITDFLNLREELSSNQDIKQDVKDFLRTAMLSMLLEISHVEHNRVSLTVGKTKKQYPGVKVPLLKKLETMINDLEAAQGLRLGKFECFNGDSRSADKIVGAKKKFDLVITSPPYPNRFSYIRETRPHMFMLGMVDTPYEVGELEMSSIGGTWGKATWTLKKPVPNLAPIVEAACRPYIKKIRDEMMRNYVLLFFNNMYMHSQSLINLMSDRARLAYVVGNSKIQDIPIPTDEILAKIFNDTGAFKAVSTYRMRKRHSQSGLYEAVLMIDAKPSN